MAKIVGHYQGQPVEIIDTFNTFKEAMLMLHQYRMAFGSDFRLWIE